MSCTGTRLINPNSCLDNVELGYLGAPWPEYEACAQKIGIDVLRYAFNLTQSAAALIISPDCLFQKAFPLRRPRVSMHTFQI